MEKKIIQLTKRPYHCYNGSSNPMHLDNCIINNERKEDSMNSSVSVISFIHAWLETVKKNETKPATFNRLMTSANTVESYPIASILVCNLKTSDFQAYVNKLIADGYARTTIKKLMEIISAATRYAYNNRIIDFDPCKAVKVPNEVHIIKKPKDTTAYTKEEQEAIKPILSKHDYIGYYAIELMLETGMRVGEILALDWDDIDLAHRKIHVHKTVVNLENKSKSYIQDSAKSKSSNRIVPLSVRAVAILKELQALSNKEYLFDYEGDRLCYSTLRRQCRRACESASIAFNGLHIWRHTFATNQYYRGTDVKILSKILGHANASITYNIYIHLYGDGFDDMLKAVS